MFRGTDMKPFEKKVWLASPTMHGEEMKYMKEAYDTNWMSTVGANINEVERIAAEKAFEMYPEVKLVVCAELYGFPGGIREIKEICEKHGALLIEDAAEAMGATYEGRQCGSFGDYSAISYNGNNLSSRKVVQCLPIERPTQVKEVA